MVFESKWSASFKILHQAGSVIRIGTQFGTQKCAERAIEAVDAVRVLLGKFSAC
jgi:hypothetical protein